MLKKALSLILIISLCFCLASCGKKKEEGGKESEVYPVSQLNGPKKGDTIVTIVTDLGTIRAVIFDDLVPPLLRTSSALQRAVTMTE